MTPTKPPTIAPPIANGIQLPEGPPNATNSSTTATITTTPKTPYASSGSHARGRWLPSLPMLLNASRLHSGSGSLGRLDRVGEHLPPAQPLGHWKAHQLARLGHRRRATADVLGHLPRLGDQVAVGARHLAVRQVEVVL